MQDLEFEWDDEKAEKNHRKHGVDFQDAVGAFFDPWSIERLDDSEDYGEDRFRMIGMAQGQVLLVSYTERQGTIRLISARRANGEERRTYEDARKR